MNNFKEGDKVWLYNGLSSPTEGIIKKVISYRDIPDTYEVETEISKILDSTKYPQINNHLYHRPSQKRKLINQIRDDIIHLEWVLEDFLEKYGEDESTTTP